MRIMIVDDRNDMRFLAREAVRNRFPDAEITLAEDGDDAMLKTREWNDYDLVITDLQMPGMDGSRLGFEIRELGYKNILVLWTGSVRVEIPNSANFNQIIAKDRLGDYLRSYEEG